MKSSRLAIVTLLLLCAFQAAPSLTDGVKTIAAPGLPGEVSVWGENAFVVAAAPSGRLRRAVVAGATFGKGKVLAFAHDGFLTPESLAKGDTRAIYNNVLKWMDLGDGAIKVCAIGGTGEKFAKTYLPKAGFVPMEEATIAFATASDVSEEEAGKLTKFVESGGRLVIAQCGWGWEQLNPGKKIGRDLPANLALEKMGLAFTGESTGSDKGKLIDVHPEDATATHALLSLRGLAKVEKKSRPTASATVITASGFAPEYSTFAKELSAGMGKLSADDYVATPKHPLDVSHTFERIALTMELEKAMEASVADCKAFPGSDVFPGAVPASTPRVTRELDVDMMVPRWHSTGLYAAPGEKITFVVPKGARELRLRIGAWTDNISGLDKWPRPPAISKDWPLGQADVSIASPFGGPIYIEVPKPIAGHVGITVTGAVEAPMYELGKTKADDWKKIRENPAPWAELIAPNKIILTVPSASVRTLEDPEALMQHWTKVLDAMADFGGIPRERRSAERMVLDEEISAGYMHSGYPIMTHMDVAKSIVDLDALHRRDSAWGFYHELGHNHQQPEWTFEGTGEVTNNVFDVYVLETVCGLSPDEAGARATGGRAMIGVRKYLANPDFEKWKSDPFLALAMYIELRHAFGWEPFKKAFAEYRALPRGEKPKTEIGKHDQWMVRMSRATGHDLSAYFAQWAVPVSEEAKASVKDLPSWKYTPAPATQPAK